MYPSQVPDDERVDEVDNEASHLAHGHPGHGASGEDGGGGEEEKDKARDNSNPGYKSGMKTFFQNVSEAQQGEEGDFSVESRYSDEDSEIKNILGSGKRNSKYVVKSDEESLNKSKGYKIPVLDTSESEFEESELSKAGFSNFAFDEKE